MPTRIVPKGSFLLRAAPTALSPTSTGFSCCSNIPAKPPMAKDRGAENSFPSVNPDFAELSASSRNFTSAITFDLRLRRRAAWSRLVRLVAQLANALESSLPACPVVKLADDHVEIGEEGNLCVLTPDEWETLKSKILNKEL